MNREIKFRGKRLSTGEWIYGYFFYKFRTQQFAIHCDVSSGVLVDNEYEVNTSTVGQYTGLKDKNGKEIYEFDVVKSLDENLTVIYNECYAAFELQYDYPNGDVEPMWDINDKHHNLEVIGNIHSNTELL